METSNKIGSLNRTDLLSRYNLPADALTKTGLTWDLLDAIYVDHVAASSGLFPTASFVAEQLRTLSEVHSVRTRVKDAEHLAVKIIRKRLDDEISDISLDNYTDLVTDLIGVRAIHLYKADWLGIHEFVMNNWELVGDPVANVRAGDPVDSFVEQNLKVNERDYGYRSIHYLLKAGTSKKPTLVELQVRTIFEEGWSEIDHQIRYPYDQDNAILAGFLVIMNSLSGTADAMGSYIAFLKQELDKKDDAYNDSLKQYEDVVAKLRSEISKLSIDSKEKEKLEKRVKELEKHVPKYAAMPTIGSIGYFESVMGTLNDLAALPSGSVKVPSLVDVLIGPRQNVVIPGQKPHKEDDEEPK